MPKVAGLFATLLLIIVSGCTSHTPQHIQTFEAREITFKFMGGKSTIDSPISLMRATESGTKDLFVEGDEVGLFAYDPGTKTQKYFILTYNGTEWLPRLTASSLGLSPGSESLQVTAYYPAIKDYESLRKIPNNPQFDIPLRADQRLRSFYDQEDKLVGYENIGHNSSDVTMILYHKMLCFNIVLEGEWNPENQVFICSPRTMHIDAADGSTKEGESYQWVRPYNTKENRNEYSAYVYPSSGLKIGFSRGEADTPTAFYELSPEQLSKCLPGRELTLRLKNTTASKNNPYASKRIWMHGMEASPVYPEGEWIKDEKMGILPYKPEYGWYDINKRNYIDHSTPDLNLCWAATSTNMILWWYRLNQPYSSRYHAWFNRKHSPGRPGQDLIPEPSFSPLLPASNGLSGGSPIFDYFRNHFVDEVGYVFQGLDWYFLGTKPQRPTGINLDKAGGFFRDVYPTGKMSWYVSKPTKKQFNEVIRHAIENKEVVALLASAHARNIWGAEFDKEGNVSHLYVTDNNYGNVDATRFGGAACYRLEISYRTSPTDQACIKTTGNSPIMRLVVMGLRDKELKDFVETNCPE